MHDHPHDHADLQHVYEQVPPSYWDDSYRTNLLQRVYHDWRFFVLRRMLRDLPRGGSVLDVGCGGGFSLERTLRGRDDLDVHGIDVTDELIAYARAHRPRFRFGKATGETLPYPDGRFDAVLYLDVIEHLVDPRASLREARRVLKPGGRVVVLVVQEHHPAFRVIWGLWLRLKGKVWHEAHLRVYSTASLRRELEEAGFRVLEVRPVHLGMSIAVSATPV